MSDFKTQLTKASYKAMDKFRGESPQNDHLHSWVAYRLGHEAGALWLLQSELMKQVEDAISSLPTLQSGQFQYDSPLGRLRDALEALRKAREGEGEG